VITEENNIIKFTVDQTEEGEDPVKAAKQAKKAKAKVEKKKGGGEKEKEDS